MKVTAQSLLTLLTLALAIPTSAQTIPAGTFKHIIIVVQENRTPDNLFGLAGSGVVCGHQDPFEPGVDLENGGPAHKLNDQVICNMPLPLSAWDADAGVNKIIDPGHHHEDWDSDYRKKADGTGNMDGFCHEYGNPAWPHPCPSYSFVRQTDVQPYFDIASNYSFANYMFQTSEGPSFEAHQFLFTGTSAPVAPGNNFDLDFVANNPDFSNSGCPQPLQNNGLPKWVDPTGTLFNMNSYECYTHDSLVTDAADCNGTNHCDRGLVSWAYYTPTPGIIWSAPAGIPEVCYDENNLNHAGVAGCGSVTGTHEWNNHVRLPHTGSYSDAPIFDDLFNCNLPQVSWVIPDFNWSDHPQDNGNATTTAYGPSWVGDIIDAVGGGMTGSICNRPSANNAKYWVQEPTLVIVVWDDWGGWFDHVPPFNVVRSSNNTSCPSSQNNGWGCGYTYGFRVPLLVVSPYTGTQNGQSYSSYVSGACGPGQSSCPNFGQNNVYVHDFGSILAFTEYNFGMPWITKPSPFYADYNAPDWGPQRNNIPLSDFFSLPVSEPRPFVSITTQKDFNYFRNFHVYNSGWVPTGPDDDNAADE